MANGKDSKVDIILPSKEAENVDESASAPQSDVLKEMPTVTTLLRRKRLTPSAKSAGLPPSEPRFEKPTQSLHAESENVGAPTVLPSRRRTARSIIVQDDAVAAANNQTKLSPIGIRANNGPPVFRGTLALERLDLKGLRERLSAHRRSIAMQKLDYLGYFSAHFAEMAHFEARHPDGFTATMGFGNQNLVSGVTGHVVSAAAFPALFDGLSSVEPFLMAFADLDAEEQGALRSLGFAAAGYFGVFPIVMGQIVSGFWICAANAACDISRRELSALKQLLAGDRARRWWPF